MRKKNKLYTANKWNQPMFAQGVDREHQNIFDGMFSSDLRTSTQGLDYGYGVLGNPTQINQSQIASMKTPTISSTSNSSSSGMSGLAQAGMAGGMTLADNIQIGNSKRGLWDAADPVYYLANGRESAVGNGLSDAGVSVFKASAQQGNGMGMLLGAGLKVLGGVTNAAVGTKWNTDTINNIENNTTSMRTNAEGLANSNTSEDFLNKATGLSTAGLNFSKKDIGTDGWFTHKVGKKYNNLLAQQSAAKAYASHALVTGAQNVDKTTDNNALTSFAAYGGQLDPMGNGAIDYGFISDYLIAKNRAVDAKNKVPNNIFGSLQSPQTMFALGGDVQSNGTDFTDGLAHIDAGGSHEENPYDGVQVGINAENGQPNLVEEGETIFDDYVYSKRIKADAETKKKFHVGKNSDISFADLSKKLEKESEERPNDAISQAALTKQMHTLAEEQERQKAEEQQREAQEAFEQLPPEQQQEIMQQMAMEEQQAQQQEAQQAQAMQESQEQPMEGQEQQEPQQMVDEQMQAQQPQMEEQQLNACGGMLNRYDKGGDLKTAIYKALGFYTDRQFDDWKKSNKLDDVDWNTADKNTALWNAIGSKGSVVKHLMDNGYFAGYTPPSNTLTFDFKHGGWGKEDYDAWDGSTDAAWQEAVKKGLVKKGMNSEEIGKALSQTDAYKRGSDWLKASDANRLQYLQAIYNSEDAPKAARAFAGKYVDKNGWLKDAKTDYQTIFEDPNGTGVRNTHPGTYWKTPNEVLREARKKNYVVNEDGTIDEIIGDVPQELKLDGVYNWKTKDYDEAANYYRAATPNAKANEKGSVDNEEVEPIHKSTWGRYAGLFGPVVGLGMQAAGIGKPDYSKMDAALEVANGAPALATYRPIGNYMQYRPMDIWQEQNRLNANARATDRAIMNNASPIGTKMAGLIANGYNNQIAGGNSYRQGLEYNDALRYKQGEYNRGTDMYNATAFNNVSATNAQILNNNKNFKAQMQMDAAKQRMAADSQWNQGIYGNVSALFKGLGEWGKENQQHNMIADMAADGIFGTMGDQNIGKGYITRKVKKAAKGGKINRKRGLTI